MSVDPLLWVVVYVTCISGNTGKLNAIKCLNYRGSKEESEEKYRPVATSKCNFFKTCNMNRLLNHSSCRGNCMGVGYVKRVKFMYNFVNTIINRMLQNIK